MCVTNEFLSNHIVNNQVYLINRICIAKVKQQVKTTMNGWGRLLIIDK